MKKSEFDWNDFREKIIDVQYNTLINFPLTAEQWRIIGNAWELPYNNSYVDQYMNTEYGICDSLEYSSVNYYLLDDFFCDSSDRMGYYLGPTGKNRKHRAMVCYLIAAMIECGDIKFKHFGQSAYEY